MPRELELFEWRRANVIFPPFWVKKGLTWTQISIISAISIIVIVAAGTGFSVFTVFVVYANNGNSNSSSSTTTAATTTATTTITITFTQCIADGLAGNTKLTSSTNDADCAKDCKTDSFCAVYLYINSPGCVLFDSTVVLISPVVTFYPYTVKYVNGNPVVPCPP